MSPWSTPHRESTSTPPTFLSIHQTRSTLCCGGTDQVEGCTLEEHLVKPSGIFLLITI